MNLLRVERHLTQDQQMWRTVIVHPTASLGAKMRTLNKNNDDDDDDDDDGDEDDDDDDDDADEHPWAHHFL